MYNLLPKIPEKFWRHLEQEFTVIRSPYKRELTRTELLKFAQDCEGVVAGLEKYDEYVIRRLPQLRCISRTGAGIDNIDEKAAKKYEVVVLNTPDAVTQPVAELTVAMMISLLRNLPELNHDLHKGRWNQIHGNLLEGKTVGIVGVGRIGKRVAELLRPFACKILGNDLKPDYRWHRKHKILHVSKKRLYSQSDIVTMHPSFFPGNKYMINRKSLGHMKQGVIFLNLSRGPIVQETALTDALRKGHVAAAALDVFEKEPYRGPLAKMHNVILTPHIGASTHESRYLMQKRAIENLVAVLEQGQ